MARIWTCPHPRSEVNPRALLANALSSGRRQCWRGPQPSAFRRQTESRSGCCRSAPDGHQPKYGNPAEASRGHSAVGLGAMADSMNKDAIRRLVEQDPIVANAEAEQSRHVGVNRRHIAAASFCVVVQAGEDAHGGLLFDGADLGLNARREANLLQVRSASGCLTSSIERPQSVTTCSKAIPSGFF